MHLQHNFQHIMSIKAACLSRYFILYFFCPVDDFVLVDVHLDTRIHIARNTQIPIQKQTYFVTEFPVYPLLGVTDKKYLYLVEMVYFVSACAG